jgi:hypothetical protein
MSAISVKSQPLAEMFARFQRQPGKEFGHPTHAHQKRVVAHSRNASCKFARQTDSLRYTCLEEVEISRMVTLEL